MSLNNFLDLLDVAYKSDVPFRVAPAELRDMARKFELTAMTHQSIRTNVVLDHSLKVQQACLDFAAVPREFETFVDRAAIEHNAHMLVSLSCTP